MRRKDSDVRLKVTWHDGLIARFVCFIIIIIFFFFFFLQVYINKHYAMYVGI